MSAEVTEQFEDDDLTSSNQNKRNWKGIFIAMLVISVVLGLIVVAVMILMPYEGEYNKDGIKITISDFINQKYTPLRHNGTWISGKDLMYKDEWESIVRMDANNLSTSVIMPNVTFKRINPVKFMLSPDGLFLLLVHNVHTIFRHTYTAEYSIYNTLNKELWPLQLEKKDTIFRRMNHAEWGPSNHNLLFVHEYDVYFKPDVTTNEVYSVTDTGLPGMVQNGIPDWIYEEEILKSNSALWFSPDGRSLIYGFFDDSVVQEQYFQWFGVHQEETPLYPVLKSVRYPKAGTSNPMATLMVADLKNLSNIRHYTIRPPLEFEFQETYFCALTWVNNMEASVVWVDRAQTFSIVTICKYPTWQCQEAYRITSDKKGWIEMPDAPLYSPDGNAYLGLSPILDQGAGSFRHIICVNITTNVMVPLTLGKFTVNKILAWDHHHQIVYFLGVPLEHPGEVHLYWISSKLPRSRMMVPNCITCPASLVESEFDDSGKVSDTKNEKQTQGREDYQAMIESGGQVQHKKKKKVSPILPRNARPKHRPCTYHDIWFSPTLEHFVLECLGPEVPMTALYKTNGLRTRDTVKNETFVVIKPIFQMMLQNNSKLVEKVEKLAKPVYKSFPVIITDGSKTQVRLSLPPILDEREITQYPLVLQLYNGPGTQLVTDRWKIDWDYYLTTSKDYIVAQIDARGSGGQGFKLEHHVYKKLGSIEATDQLEVVEYLQQQLHFIDKRRTAVWGWSYGGFLSTLILANREKPIFNCGIAISPIASWKLYDSVFAERYLGTPNSSSAYKAYSDADLTNIVENLHDKAFFLIHGTADNNVHFQQSMVLIKALSDAGIMFQQLIYPDEDHAFNGVKQHLYGSMVTFLEECYRKQIPIEEMPGLRNGGHDIYNNV